MGEDAIATSPRREGCLSSGCGCLAIAVLALLVAGGVLVWLLGRWDSTQKAWDRLPADTTWAMQVHDLRSVLRAAVRDPGVRSLLLSLEDVIEREILAAGGRGEAESAVRRFLADYDSVSVLHTMTVPNSLLIGGFDATPEKSFLIFRSPTWLRWLCALPGSGFDGIREETDGEGRLVYFSARDGWMIAALDRDMAQKVLDGWDARAMPLGVGCEGDGAHALFALRERGEEKADDSRRTPLEPSHFTFADPFAAPVAGASVAADKRDGLSLRLALRPVDAGWAGEGEVAATGDFDKGRSLAAFVDDIFGGETPTVTTPRPYDAVVSLRFSPEARQKALDALSAVLGKRGTERMHVNLARRWLFEGWLKNSGRVWTALAAAPVMSGAELPYPPLPVFSLGWTIAPGREPTTAAEAFSRDIGYWLDSLRAPGGPLPLQNLRESVSYSLDASPDSPGGEVRLPPVMVNAARPAWRFHVRQTPPTGLLASDPAGIPDSVSPGHIPAAALAEPRAGHASLVGGWDLGDGFTDGLFAVIEDRFHWHLSTMPNADIFLRTAKKAANTFPRGSIHVDCDTNESRAVFRFTAPTGVER